MGTEGTQGVHSLREAVRRFQPHDEHAVDVPRPEDPYGLLDCVDEYLPGGIRGFSRAEGTVQSLVPYFEAETNGLDACVVVPPQAVQASGR